MPTRSKSYGGAYLPKANYTRTGSTDTGGTYANATITSPTISSPTITSGLVNLLKDTSGVNRFIPNPTAKTIVDGSATALFEVAIASGDYATGAAFYAVFATDGTDVQAMSGLITYAGVNKAGTITRAIGYATGNDAKAVSAGTLTLAWSGTDDTGKMTVKLTPTGSLTETTYTVVYSVFPTKGTVTIL